MEPPRESGGIVVSYEGTKRVGDGRKDNSHQLEKEKIEYTEEFNNDRRPTLTPDALTEQFEGFEFRQQMKMTPPSTDGEGRVQNTENGINRGVSDNAIQTVSTGRCLGRKLERIGGAWFSWFQLKDVYICVPTTWVFTVVRYWFYHAWKMDQW